MISISLIPREISFQCVCVYLYTVCTESNLCWTGHVSRYIGSYTKPVLENIHGSRWPTRLMWPSDVWSELLEKERIPQSTNYNSTAADTAAAWQCMVWYEQIRRSQLGTRTIWLTVVQVKTSADRSFQKWGMRAKRGYSSIVNLGPCILQTER